MVLTSCGTCSVRLYSAVLGTQFGLPCCSHTASHTSTEYCLEIKGGGVSMSQAGVGGLSTPEGGGGPIQPSGQTPPKRLN